MATPRIKSEIIYQYLRDYIRENGFSPSFREISIACEISIPTVQLCLMWLELQGRLRRRNGVARSIVLLDADDAAE